MISRELLSEVLGVDFEIKDFRILENIAWIDDKPPVSNGYKGWRKTINIHELAHMVKEWAYAEGYVIKSYRCFTCHDDYKVTVMFDTKTIHSDCAKSEPEAVFKAGEWILKELNNDN